VNACREKWPLSTTVDAFCLYGDRDLAFPYETAAPTARAAKRGTGSGGPG
jgi:hypothetical protein